MSTQDTAARLAEMRGLHREYEFAVKERKRSINATGAFVRGNVVEGDKERATAIVKRIEADFDTALENCLVQDGVKPRDRATARCNGVYKDFALREAGRARTDDPLDLSLSRPMVASAIFSRKTWDEKVEQSEREIVALVKKLPIWQWAQNVFGLKNGKTLAFVTSYSLVVGDDGGLETLLDRDSPAKLWKRLGLAPSPHGHAYSVHRYAGDLSAAEWVAAGYNGSRLATMRQFSESIVKNAHHNEDHLYVRLYRARKAYEIERAQRAGMTLLPQGSVPAAERANNRPPQQINRRALRYVEKRVVKHIWTAWRAGGTPSPDSEAHAVAT